MSVSVSSKVAGNRLYQHMQNLKKVEQAISPSVFNVFRRASIEIAGVIQDFLSSYLEVALVIYVMESRLEI